MITSTSNKQVKNVNKLRTKSKERRTQKLFVAEGIRMVLETPHDKLKQIFLSESFLSDSENRRETEKYLGVSLDKLTEVEMITLDCRAENIGTEKLGQQDELAQRVAGTEIMAVSDEVMKQMSDTVTPQGILAVIRMPEYSLEDVLSGDDTHLLILENLQDPGNLGTMFRTAEGAGVSGLILSRDTVDVFLPKVIRSTMGAIFRVPFLVSEDLHETLETVKSRGVKLYAAHLRGEKMYDAYDYTGKVGFLIGNEGNGLTDETADQSDVYIRIPMGGKLESLNAAMAAGILMYEVNRQRRNK